MKARVLKTHHFHTKLLYQKPLLRQMVSTKWTYHKERIFASYYFIFCFENFVSISILFLELLIKSWFDVPTTQMPKFVLFVSAGVLFDSVFSLWVSLISSNESKWAEMTTIEPKWAHVLIKFLPVRWHICYEFWNSLENGKIIQKISFCGPFS